MCKRSKALLVLLVVVLFTSGWSVAPVQAASVNPAEKSQDVPISISINGDDEGICRKEMGDITASGHWTLPLGMTAVLQTEFHVVEPFATAPVYKNTLETGTGKPVAFSITGIWPGVSSSNAVVEVHFGASLLGPDGMPIAQDQKDYYWYPYICPPDVPPDDQPFVAQEPSCKMDVITGYAPGSGVLTWEYMGLSGTKVVSGSFTIKVKNPNLPVPAKLHVTASASLEVGGVVYSAEPFDGEMVCGGKKNGGPDFHVYCPGCGPGKHEKGKGPDDVVVIHYSNGECRPCQRTQAINVDDARLTLRSIHPVMYLTSATEKEVMRSGWPYKKVIKDAGGVKVTQLFLIPETFQGLDRDYYLLDASKKDIRDNLVPYTLDGQLYTEVYGWNTTLRSRFVACSCSVGPWDVTRDGIAIRNRCASSSEWVTWLLDYGILPRTYEGAAQAIEWSLALWNSPDGRLALPNYHHEAKWIEAKTTQQ